MRKEKHGRIYVDDMLVTRTKYDDGSRVSKFKAAGLSAAPLGADELMAYCRENDQKLAESKCLGLIMRNRKLNLPQASAVLNIARYGAPIPPVPARELTRSENRLKQFLKGLKK